ncbi:MAG: winged helix-turn-helix domain-containing protein [Pseudomonadota bacterium]
MKISIDGWRIDSKTRQATKADTTAILSPRALKLLMELADANGDVLERADLLHRIWPNVTVGDESLSQAVAELRRKLGNRTLIETIAKGGYRLTVPVIRTVETLPNAAPGNISDFYHLEAHALCLDARNEIVRCGEGSIARADTLTAEAVYLAPNCADIRAERAIALVRAHTYWSEGRYLLDSALKEAETAVSLNPKLAVAQSALGYALSMHGHFDAAEEAHRAALAEDPRDPLILHNAAWHLMSRGRRRAAIAYFEQAACVDPDNIKAYLLAAQLSQPVEPRRSRRNAERGLKRALARIEEDAGDPRALSAVAAFKALLGEHHEAYDALTRIDVHNSTQAIFHASSMAVIGENDRAIDILEELFDHGWRDVFWLDSNPSLSPLRGDRRFMRMREHLAVA